MLETNMKCAYCETTTPRVDLQKNNWICPNCGEREYYYNLSKEEITKYGEPGPFFIKMNPGGI